MSIVPLLLQLTENYPTHCMMYPEDIQHQARCPQQCLKSCSRPMSNQQYPLKSLQNHNRCKNSANKTTSGVKDGFQLSIDTKDFSPNEISVKTIDNNTIVVEGKHDEKADEHGHISRHFIRKYTLPNEVNVNDVISTLSRDGKLTIKVTPKPKDKSTERMIQIQQTGIPHRPVQINKAEKITNENKIGPKL